MDFLLVPVAEEDFTRGNNADWLLLLDFPTLTDAATPPTTRLTPCIFKYNPQARHWLRYDSDGLVGWDTPRSGKQVGRQIDTMGSSHDD